MDSKVMKEQFYTDKNSIEDRSEVSVESEKNLEAFKASIKTEAEVKRRVKFYKKLTYIQSLAFKLCSQEEQLRKRYVNESKKGKQNSKQLLRNIKVPNLDIDTDGTTDLELNKMNRDMTLSEEDMGCEDFMLIQYNQMMEHINNLVGKDKNTKIQNLQQLLTIATSVFKKIYEKNSQKIDLKSSKLIQQRQEQTMRIKELQQRCIRYQTQIDQYQKSVEMLHATIAEKEQYALNIDQVKNEQIAKQKSLYQKVLADRKKVEAELKSQVKLNEELFNQFSMLDEDFEKQKLQNSQLKEMLAQKEVQLINMQKQLSDKTSKIGVQSIIYDPNEQAENELKQVVVQNLNQKIQQNSDQIIKKLQNQNQLLKSDNESYEAEIESLQQQIQQITEQLNKLILKKTEDIHVQVDSHQDTMGFKNDSISIGDDISIGQNAIFMPYNNNLYIGVSSKDEDRTLCNVNGLHQPNYILNLDCFPSKTRELLSECSLLLVLKVEHLSKTGINYSVEGKIQYLLGFEEDNLAVKNYVPYLG